MRRVSRYEHRFRNRALVFAVCLGILFALFPADFAGAAIPPVGSAVPGQSSATYRIGNDRFFTTSNLITTLVSSVYSISITPSGTVSLPAFALDGSEGDTLYSTFTVENLGNATDSVSVGYASVPPSTIGLDQVIFFHDANANGSFDPGEDDPAFLSLDMGESVDLSVAIVLTTGQGAGQTYVEVKVSSVNDAGVYQTTVVLVTTQQAPFTDLHFGPYENAEALLGGEGSDDDVTAQRVGYSDDEIQFRNDVKNLGTVADMVQIEIADTSGWPSGLTITFEDTTGQVLPTAPQDPGAALVGRIDAGETRTVLTRVSTGGTPFHVIGIDSLEMRLQARSLIDTLITNDTRNRILLPGAINPAAVISLRQTFTRNIASVGDVVTLIVTVSNISDSVAVDSVVVSEDVQPVLNFLSSPGFKATGQSLTWQAGALQPGQSKETVIKFITNSRVTQGETRVAGRAEGVAITGETVFAATVVNVLQIQNDIFSENGVIYGDVFIDDNANQKRDDGESGIRGVAVYLESGEFAVTDSLGKFAIPRTFSGYRIVRLDEGTLPPDIEFVHEREQQHRQLTERIVIMVPSGHATASFPLQRKEIKPVMASRSITCQELVSVRQRARVIYQIPAISSTYFEIGQAYLKTDHLGRLEPIVAFLNKHRDWVVVVEGHTDSIPMDNGAFDSNEELSVARASSVMRYLTANGIPRERIVVRGHGDRQPVATNSTDEGRSQNRRVEIEFLPADMRDADASTMQRVTTELTAISARADSFDVNIIWDISTNSVDTFDVDVAVNIPDAIGDPNVSVRNGGEELILDNGSFVIDDFARANGIQLEISGHVAAGDTSAIRNVSSVLSVVPRGTVLSDSVPRTVLLRPLTRGNHAGQTQVLTLALWQEAEPALSDTLAESSSIDTGSAGRGRDPQAGPVYGIIEPDDGALFTRQNAITIKVRVPLGSLTELFVNGAAVAQEQMGQKVIRVADKVEELTFFGVGIAHGWNSVSLRAKPVSGAGIEDSVAVALAGQPRDLVAEQTRVFVPANGSATGEVRFGVLDQHGLSVIDGVIGTVVEGDTLLLNTDARPAVPGFQVVTREGYFHLRIKSSQTTGKDRLVVALDNLDAWCEVAYVPPRRPMFFAGIAEASLGAFESSGDADPLGLEGFGEDVKLDGEARLIAQGTGRGGVNMTARLDTDNRYEDPLLKTINPDEQYSIYGDASEMYYAAPSQTGNYIAFEKGESFLRYGDFRSPFTQGEFLTYNRSTTGLSTAIVSGDDGVRGFVAETDLATIQDEIQGDGTSGFYFLSRSPIVENSIRIVLQTRDRFQFEKILDIRPLVQFRDYTLNYFDGAVLFKEPIAVTTDRLNPVFIVANYEVKTNKEGQYLYGFRGDVARFGRFKLGAEAIGRGRDNLNYALYGFDGGVEYRGLGLRGEFARSDDDMAGEGSAYKIKALYSGRPGEASVYYRNVDRDFINPSFAGGKTERYTRKAGFDARLNMASRLRIESEGFYHDLAQTNETETNLAAMGVIDTRSFSFGAGARTASEKTQDGEIRSLLSVLGFGVKRANGLTFHTHWEHNLRDDVVRRYPDRLLSLLKIPLHKRLTLVTNHEYRSSHDQPATHQFLSGVEYKLRPGSVAYTKYSMNRTGSDQRMNAISGLRQNFRLTDKVTGLLNIEGQLSGSGERNDEYLVLKTGINRINRGVSLIEGQYEYRWQTSSNRHLINLIAVRELDDGLAILFKEALSVDFPMGKSAALHSQGRLAGVYRPDVSWIRTLLLLKSLYDRYSPVDPEAINWRLVFSSDVNIIPAFQHELRLKLAAKRVENYSNRISETTNSYLVLSQYVFHFARLWDVNIWGRFLGQGAVGTQQFGAGAEVGRLFWHQIRISAGYAVNGFEERDLSENDAWARGFGLRVQYILSDWILNELGF